MRKHQNAPGKIASERKVDKRRDKIIFMCRSQEDEESYRKCRKYAYQTKESFVLTRTFIRFRLKQYVIDFVRLSCSLSSQAKSKSEILDLNVNRK